MGKVIDNSWTPNVSAATDNKSNPWANPPNAIQSHEERLGTSTDYAPRFQVVIDSGADTATVTPTNDHDSSDYMRFYITDGKGNEQTGTVADLVTPGTEVLDVTGFDYSVDWTITIFALKTGDETEVFYSWNIPTPSGDPTVVVPAGYND